MKENRLKVIYVKKVGLTICSET